MFHYNASEKSLLLPIPVLPTQIPRQDLSINHMEPHGIVPLEEFILHFILCLQFSLNNIIEKYSWELEFLNYQ